MISLSGEIENHLDMTTIEDCRNLVAETDATLRHSLREENKCVDLLTTQEEQDFRVMIHLFEITFSDVSYNLH